MRISGFTTTRPNMPDGRTYEDFMKFLGGLYCPNKILWIAGTPSNWSSRK